MLKKHTHHTSDKTGTITEGRLSVGNSMRELIGLLQ